MLKNIISIVSWVLVICGSFCRLTLAQVYYEDDPCDFGTYSGICLVISKCTELPAIMAELGLKSAQVERCGFSVMEEIICCPTRPKPVKTPKEVPNVLIDPFKPFEFRPPPENETTAASTNSIAIDDWFASNFKKNFRNPKSEIASSTANVQSFGNNEQTVQKTAGGAVESEEDDSQRFDFIFNGNFRPSEMPPKNSVEAGHPNEEHLQKINEIFNVNPPLGGNAENTLKVDLSFNENQATNRKPIAQDWKVRDLNEAEMREINAIFNVNFISSGNPASENTHKFNAVVNPSQTSNGLTAQTNSFGNLERNEYENQRINAIFNVNFDFSGNTANENTQKPNAALNSNPASIVMPVQEIFFGKVERNEDQNQRINAMFNVNSQFSGNPANENIQQFNPSQVSNASPVQTNSFGEVERNAHENQRINAIFNVNSDFNGNSASENTQKFNSPFNTISAANGRPVQTNLFGNIQHNEDQDKKINSIFLYEFSD